jgi:signal transduction histidine kinase
MMRLARQTGLAIEVADHAREMADVAVHEERRHLALTIHDSVGAILFSIGAATRDLETERECEPALRARLKYIEQQVAKASAQLRQALRSLSEVPQEVALGVALRAECRALEERTGMKAGCVVLGELPALEEGRAKVLLQAAREALHNAEKHARARSVVVSLHAADGGVSVVVADDGVGLGQPADGENGSPSSGLGLEATATRLGQVGGQLVVSTNEDGGCTMRAWLPC